MIIGDFDQTTPAQINKRYRRPMIENSAWQSWLNDKRIVHIFVAHLDTVSPADRVTPIPLGLNSWEYAYHPDERFTRVVKKWTFPAERIKILFESRMKRGRRKNDRMNATDACEQLPYCHFPEEGMQFAELVKKFTFFLSLSSGGVDPNPLAFNVLLSGGIPIIASFPGDTMYEDMPIVIVDGSFSASSPHLSIEFLEAKLEEFRPYFVDSMKRASVLDKLTT